MSVSSSANRPVVLLVHGLWMNSLFMKRLGRRLSHAGFAVEYFSYPTVHTRLDEHVQRLRERIAAMPSPQRMIGHSLGGLMLLDALAGMQNLTGARLVLLGSPLQGSDVARKLASHRIGRLLLGGSGGRLQSATQTLPAEVAVSVIAGNFGLGLGMLLTGGRRSEGDGAVSVDEARMEGLAHFEVQKVNHSGLLFSRQTAQRAIDCLI